MEGDYLSLTIAFSLQMAYLYGENHNTIKHGKAVLCM